MKRHTEEQKRHMREAALRFWEGKPDHFRQRFAEDKLFVTFNLTLNAHLIGTGAQAQPWCDLANFISRHPEAKFISVADAGSRQNVSQLVGDLVRPSRVTSDDPAYLAAQQAKKDALTDEEYAAQRGKILSEL